MEVMLNDGEVAPPNPTVRAPQTLQQESYHQTNQPDVGTVAVSERATINPEDLRDGDGTLSLALQLWSSRNSPVQYNKWQSVFFA